jgi:hypothetical protein
MHYRCKRKEEGLKNLGNWNFLIFGIFLVIFDGSIDEWVGDR